MKKIFIVANWKSNKTESEAKDWLALLPSLKEQDLSNKEIIVCPAFIHLSAMKVFIEQNLLPIKLGAQNISSFDQGAHTGEVNGQQLKDFVEYVLIGHSERRKYFTETKDLLKEKVKMASKYGLKVIFCADNEKSFIPEGVSIVTYEPPTSISPGPADTPENAEKAGAYFKANFKVPVVLYGGSVTVPNVNSFTKMPNIDGVLVGRASLDAQEFYTIIKNA